MAPSLVPLLLLAALACVADVAAGGAHVAAGGADVAFFPLQHSSEKQGLSASEHYRRLFAEEPARRKLASSVPLGGSTVPLGYYYITIQLGTPPQNFDVIVDTGSDLLFVTCATCTNCGKHTNAPFDPQKSSTFRSTSCTSPTCGAISDLPCGNSNNCQYQGSYAEGSTVGGLLGSDVFLLPNGGGVSANGTAPRVVFGCQTQESGDVQTQPADGILGMKSSQVSALGQLAITNSIAPIFSLCLGGPSGGAFALGGTKELPGTVYTPLVNQTTSRYYIQLSGVNVGGANIPLSRPVILNVDSGSTFTYLPTDLYNSVNTQLSSRISSPELKVSSSLATRCWQFTGGIETLGASFPNITLQLGGNVNLLLAPLGYLFQQDGAVCLGLLDGNKVTKDAILGGISLHNTLVTFDLQNERLGLAPAACANLTLTSASTSVLTSAAPVASSATPGLAVTSSNNSAITLTPSTSNTPGGVQSPTSASLRSRALYKVVSTMLGVGIVSTVLNLAI